MTTLKALGRSPDSEEGKSHKAQMDALADDYRKLPPANCPAHAKLHRQAGLRHCTPEQAARQKAIYDELGLDY